MIKRHIVTGNHVDHPLESAVFSGISLVCTFEYVIPDIIGFQDLFLKIVDELDVIVDLLRYDLRELLGAGGVIFKESMICSEIVKITGQNNQYQYDETIGYEYFSLYGRELSGFHGSSFHINMQEAFALRGKGLLVFTYYLSVNIA